MSLLCGEPVAAATSPTLCAALLAVSSEGAERDRAGVVGDEPMPCKQAKGWSSNLARERSQGVQNPEGRGHAGSGAACPSWLR